MNGWTITEKEWGKVRAALNRKSMLHLLDEAVGRHPASPRRRAPFRCAILDARYDPSSSWNVLYQLDERLVLGMLGWNGATRSPPDGARSINGLGMQVYVFPEDPSLTRLADTLDPEAMKALLSRVLPDCRTGRARVLRCRTQLVRYRPTRRCTLRIDYWLVAAESGAIVPRVLYAKVYHDLAKAKAVYEEMKLLFAAPSLAAGGIAVARPVAFVPELAVILQEPLVGTPLEGLLEWRHAPDSRRVSDGVVGAAAALAVLHAAGLDTARRRPVAPIIQRAARRAAQVGRVDRELGRRVSRLAVALAESLDELDGWGAETALVHGDCKPSQFLIGSSRVAILDFDHCGMADPASDVGAFLATLRQLDVRRSARAQAAPAPAPAPCERGHRPGSLGRRFLAEYVERAGASPGLRPRAHWYEAAALLRKAIRAFQRCPWSPLPALLVDEAWCCLELSGSTGVDDHIGRRAQGRVP